MNAFLEDLRGAVRALRVRRGFVLAAVLTLGIPIGANTAIFGVIEAALLRQLPYRDSDRVAALWSERKDGGNDPISFLDFRDLRAATTSIAMAPFVETGANVGGS